MHELYSEKCCYADTLVPLNFHNEVLKRIQLQCAIRFVVHNLTSQWYLIVANMFITICWSWNLVTFFYAFIPSWSAYAYAIVWFLFWPDYLVDESTECNSTSDILLERNREQSLIDLLIPSLVLLINLLQKLQVCRDHSVVYYISDIICL